MMALPGWVRVLLLIGSTAVALPADGKSQDGGLCTSPKIRRAWHTLSNTEKKTYLDAELCLMSKPSTLGIRGSRTKFDDFQAAHVLQMEIAHSVGQFLPFHRLFTWAHEQALQRECGYTSGQPYWEERLDAGAFSKSILFDPIYGFGGDGVGEHNCISDGPFKNYTNPLGPGYAIRDHCIDRQISDSQSASASSTVVGKCMNMTTYLDFWPCLEAGPHAAGHGGIGAQMLNPISSPGDPLFFLHHGWLDMLWAKWQAEDPGARHKDMGGVNHGIHDGKLPTMPDGMPGGSPGLPGGLPPPPGFQPVNLTRPSDVPEPLVIGDPSNVTTLSHLIYLYGIVENRTISELMDTRGFLCYEYD